MSSRDAPSSHSGPPTSPAEGKAWGWALAIVAIGLLVRLFMAAVVPLFPDETYYWEWSRHPAVGYFDHPPGIAGLIGAGTALLGHTVLGIRLGTLAAGTAASLVLLTWAGRVGDGTSALRATVMLAVMPVAAAGMILATPDAPLLLCGALTLAAVDRALCMRAGSRGELGWWLVAGLAAGVAFLSKLTAVLIPAGISLALVARPDLRSRLRSPGPWVAALVSLALSAPFLLWNSRNAWISFSFQFGHGLGAAEGSPLLRELELLGGQLGLVSPILFVLLAWACITALRDPDPRRFVPAVVALTVYGFFAVSALRSSTEANWPAMAYVPAIVVLATVSWTRSVRRWFAAGATLGLTFVVATYAQALVPWLPIDADADPVAGAYGWNEVATVALTETQNLARGGCRNVWLASRTYQGASETAFHLPGQPFVPSTNLASRSNQYDLWPGFPELAEPGDCLILFGREPGTRVAIQEIGPVFSDVTRGPLVVRTRARREVERIHFWRLRGWNGDATPFR